MAIIEPTFNTLCSRQILNQAWKIVKTKNSHGGIDGLSIADFDSRYNDLLDTILSELKEGSWKPFPYQKVQIPKNDGEKRNLGLLSVKDKVVQEAIKLLIEPMIDTLFANNNYGYRPGRGHYKAVRRTLFECGQKTSQVVLRLDIDDFFDTVDHSILFHRLYQVLHDEELNRLIQLCVRMGRVNSRH